MPLFSFTPNTVIKSAENNSNNTNFSNHSRWVNLKWSFIGTLITQTSTDYLSLPDDVTFERADLICDIAPTDAAIIVDIERSTDGGSTWVTIFTNQANRPQIAADAKTGNTTSIDVDEATAFTHLFRAKIEQIGSTIAGADLSVILRGKYNLD